MCAKAINDGVIDAVIDHEAGYLQSRDVNDIYSTTEPQQVGGGTSLFLPWLPCPSPRLCFPSLPPPLSSPASPRHASARQALDSERTQ